MYRCGYTPEDSCCCTDEGTYLSTVTKDGCSLACTDAGACLLTDMGTLACIDEGSIFLFRSGYTLPAYMRVIL